MTLDGDLLVTGATGQVGDCLLHRLGDGRRTVVAVRHRTPGSDLGRWLRWVDGDLAAGRIDLADVRPRAVIHIAALWLLPPVLPRLFDAGVAQLVAFGSTSLFGKNDSRNAAERTVVDRLAGAEAAIARQCDAAGVAWTILRPAMIYGLGRDRNVAGAARFIARTGIYPIAPPATGLRQPVHADDLAAAALAALAAPGAAGRAYNLGGGETLPYRDMIGRIFDVLGRQRRLLPVPLFAPMLGLCGRVLDNPLLTADLARRMNRDLAFDDGAAARAFGYAPRPFLAGGRGDLGV